MINVYTRNQILWLVKQIISIWLHFAWFAKVAILKIIFFREATTCVTNYIQSVLCYMETILSKQATSQNNSCLHSVSRNNLEIWEEIICFLWAYIPSVFIVVSAFNQNVCDKGYVATIVRFCFCKRNSATSEPDKILKTMSIIQKISDNRIKSPLDSSVSIGFLSIWFWCEVKMLFIIGYLIWYIVIRSFFCDRR